MTRGEGGLTSYPVFEPLLPTLSHWGSTLSRQLRKALLSPLVSARDVPSSSTSAHSREAAEEGREGWFIWRSSPWHPPQHP